MKWYRINDAGQEVEYFNTLLENVKVISVTPVMPKCKGPHSQHLNHMEYIVLRYEKITWKYPDGNLVHSDAWMSAQRLNKGNIMSRLVFDGSTHQLSLLSGDFTVIGTWSAYNNVDSHATIKHVQNGTYSIQDKSTPHYHTPDENGPYGSYGIIRFNVPGHPGIGVHSGRANAKFKPGPQHATMGCIRTTDEAMKSIKESMATSSLSTIEVRNNSGPSAISSAQRNQTHIYHGIRTQFI